MSKIIYIILTIVLAVVLLIILNIFTTKYIYTKLVLNLLESGYVLIVGGSCYLLFKKYMDG